MPPTRLYKTKNWLLRWAGAKIGENVKITSTARFFLSGKLAIGDNTWVGHEVLIIGGQADVYIGRNVDIGPRTSIVTGSHRLELQSARVAGEGFSLPVNIGNGSWIGANVTILGGVNIGDSCMVGACALVRDDALTNTVVVGVPAKPISSNKKTNYQQSQ